MRVTKASQAGEETRLGPEELEQINRLARRELTAEEVYAFSVRLCDNEVDRDGERFEPETLEELAGLFVEKISGDYFNIVGLPVSAVADRCRTLTGLSFFDLILQGKADD